jgi:hypothetical protein
MEDRDDQHTYIDVDGGGQDISAFISAGQLPELTEADEKCLGGLAYHVFEHQSSSPR